MNKLLFYLVLAIFILTFSVVAVMPVNAIPVKDAGPQDYLYSASFFGVCGSPYCSSLSPDYFLKSCGDTAYKYYCGEGKTCQDGSCVSKFNTCPEGWVGEFYCSALSPDSRLRLYQTKDCSTTSYKYSCGTSGVCESGSCISKTPDYKEQKLEVYCSGLSNAVIERWQLSDGSTEARLFNCGTDEKCNNAVCETIVCDSKLLEKSCSSLGNSRLELYQNKDCSVTSLKFNCADSEICSGGACMSKGSQCNEAKINEYCSELGNSRIEFWKLGDCNEESRKYSCSVNEQCEMDGQDAKCVEKPSPCVGFFCLFGQFFALLGWLFRNFMIILIAVGVFAYFKPSLANRIFLHKFFWYALAGIIILGMASTAFSNVSGTISSWAAWLS